MPSSDEEGRLDLRAFPGVRRREPYSGRWRSLFASVLQWTVWLYFGAIVTTWLLLRIGGDRWWFATVMLFGPRWIYAMPMAVLVPAAVFVRRDLWRPLAAAAIVLLFLVMGVCLPWGRLAAPGGLRVRVLTCNVDGLAVDANKLTALIAATQPDAVALQESSPKVRVEWPAGWQVCRAGQLLVASRYPISDVQSAICSHPTSSWPPVDALACEIETSEGCIRLCCIHLQSLHQGLSETLDRRTVVSTSRKKTLVDQIEHRQRESDDLAEWLSRFDEPLIVAGDFNMPVDSGIYWQFWSKYTNAFSSTGFGVGSTKITPMGCLSYGLRIDHVLASRDWRCSRSWVGPDVQSDHLPLLADLRLVRSANNR